ncbi:MAG TPA: MFS transporter [Thermomicrobiales bacterium]|nr:MFS transporter [Thermomicrobiales bacterium]
MTTNGVRTGSRWPLHALLAANAISGVGNKLTALAIPWFVLETTGSAARTGLVGFFTVIPVILSAIFGAGLVDRLGFKRMSIISDLLSGLTVGLIPLLHLSVGLAFWQLLVLVFLGSILDAPGATARQSLFPDVATAAGVRLERANAVAATIWRLSFLLGPVLGGLLISLIGTSNVLWIDAASCAVSALLVAQALPADRRSQPMDASHSKVGVLTNMMDGLRFIASDRLLLLLAISSTIGNALGGAMNTIVLPVFARQSFGDAGALGLMLGAFGAGALSSAALYGLVGYRVSKWLVFVVSGILSIVPIFVLATTPPLPIAIAALAVEGLASGPYGPIVSTIYQRRIPVEQRARFFGAILAADNALTPMMVLGIGLLLSTTNLTTVLILLAFAKLSIKLAVVTRPILRRMDDDDGNVPRPDAVS